MLLARPHRTRCTGRTGSDRFHGACAPNTRLSGLRAIDVRNEVGPEHIAIGPDGKLYAAMMRGNLIRMNPDGSEREIFINTGGRVLAHDPTKGTTRIVAHGFSFANGIALSSDGHSLFVNETGRYRL